MAGSFRRGKIGRRSLNRMLGLTGGAAANGAVAVDDHGGVRRTVLTLSAVPFALVDQAGVIAYVGKKIYDFPEGDVVVLSAVANLSVLGSSAGVNNTFNGDFAVGTVTASNNNTLSSTEQNIIPTTPTPAAVAKATTAKGRLAAPVSLDGTGGALAAFLNFLVDDTDHDVTTTPANLVVTGTVTIVWASAGDF